MKQAPCSKPLSPAVTPSLPSSLQRHFERLLAAESPRPKSLCVTLLGDIFGNQPTDIWLTQLVQLLQLFGINERWVRTCVYRLVQEGLLQVERAGRHSRYRLSPEASVLFALAAKRIYGQGQTPAWDGQWLVVQGLTRAKNHLALTKELIWHGFGQFDPTLLAHPTLKLDTIQALIDQHASTSTNTVTCFYVLDADPRIPALRRLRARIPHAWDWSMITNQYQEFYKNFAPLDAALQTQLTSIEPATAFALRALLIHAYRRVTLHDPHLPANLLPTNWIGHQAFALTQRLYQRLHPSSQRHLKHAGLSHAAKHAFQ